MAYFFGIIFSNVHGILFTLIDQDKNAIEAVIQFAIYHLGFAVEDIIFYGWSIGGYSSLWAASCYPDAKGVVNAKYMHIINLLCFTGIFYLL